MSPRPLPRPGLRVGLLLTASLVGGACRFGSVSPVTESIAASAEHGEAVELGESLCRLGTAMVSDAPACEDRAEHIESFQLALGRLSAYGARLSGLAGIRSVDLGAAPGAMIRLGETVSGGTLDGVERKGIETAATILAEVITTAIKRKALRKAVISTDRSVQCLAWRSVEATEVWRRELARISEAGTKADALDLELDRSRSRVPIDDEPAAPSPSPEEAADPLAPRVEEVEARLDELEHDLGKTGRRAMESERLALRSVQVIAAEHDRRLAALERGLWAVALSHHHLACHAERLGTTRDRTLRAEIGRRVACVLERERPAAERSAACRPVLERAEALRAHACEDLIRDGEDGTPIPAEPDCEPPETAP
ncbi:MAG: hypothetical protein H6712_03630 [Myxococcales bacterium]|nr:hypothetical protein [Myxococcales bacterium]MCB9712918.1 hypothetical protein [Myxococcales bacterium]